MSELVKACYIQARARALCIRIIQSRQRTARAIYAECTAACKITLPLSCCPCTPRVHPSVVLISNHASIMLRSISRQSARFGNRRNRRLRNGVRLFRLSVRLEMPKLREERRASNNLAEQRPSLMFCNNAGLYYGAKHSARLVRRGILAPDSGVI